MKHEGDLAAASASFLTWCRVEKGLAANSLASYSLDLRQFGAYCASQNWTGIPDTDCCEPIWTIFPRMGNRPVRWLAT